MKKNISDLRVRTSQEEKGIIRQRADAEGFLTISDFVRSRTLDHNNPTQEKLDKIIALLEKMQQEQLKNFITKKEGFDKNSRGNRNR